MAKLENCELWFCKLDPQRPSSRFDKENPSWECQIRTSSKEQKAEWEKLGMNVVVVDPDDGPLYYRVNLKKKSLKADGSPAMPVEVIDAKRRPVDPKSIGHGSIGHVRVFQRPYTKANGKPGISNMLVGIQLIKHLKFEPSSFEDAFEDAGETEVIDMDEAAAKDAESAPWTDETKKPEKVF